VNHKRRRPKHQRAGCLMCKPWKDERGKNSTDKERLHRADARKAVALDAELQNPGAEYGECPGGDACWETTCFRCDP
jgi:hypothetical protein